MTANLKLSEAERELGVTRWTLYRYIRQGRLPVVRLAGGHYRVSADAVAALRTATGTTTAPIDDRPARPASDERGRRDA